MSTFSRSRMDIYCLNDLHNIMLVYPILTLLGTTHRSCAPQYGCAIFHNLNKLYRHPKHSNIEVVNQSLKVGSNHTKGHNSLHKAKTGVWSNFLLDFIEFVVLSAS